MEGPRKPVAWERAYVFLHPTGHYLWIFLLGPSPWENPGCATVCRNSKLLTQQKRQIKLDGGDDESQKILETLHEKLPIEREVVGHAHTHSLIVELTIEFHEFSPPRSGLGCRVGTELVSQMSLQKMSCTAGLPLAAMTCVSRQRQQDEWRRRQHTSQHPQCQGDALVLLGRPHAEVNR